MTKTVLFLLGSNLNLIRYQKISEKLKRKDIVVSTEIIEKSSEDAVENERHYVGNSLMRPNQIIFYEQGYRWFGLENSHCGMHTLSKKTSAGFIITKTNMIPQKTAEASAA